MIFNIPHKVININDEPYLVRYYLGTFFGITFFLHRFDGSDGERNVHDHPWAWAKSFILKGGYEEELLIGFDINKGWISKKINRRWYNNIKPNTFHRISKTIPGTYTLFIHGKKIKTWGFLRQIPGGVIYHYD